jgi:hypothetical protein
LNEANVLMSCYAMLSIEEIKHIEKVIEIWNKMWKRPATESKTSTNHNVQAYGLGEQESILDGIGDLSDFINPYGSQFETGKNVVRGGSSLSAKGLALRFGVDRISVSLILDSVGYLKDYQKLEDLFQEIVKSGKF